MKDRLTNFGKINCATANTLAEAEYTVDLLGSCQLKGGPDHLRFAIDCNKDMTGSVTFSIFEGDVATSLSAVQTFTLSGLKKNSTTSVPFVLEHKQYMTVKAKTTDDVCTFNVALEFGV